MKPALVTLLFSSILVACASDRGAVGEHSKSPAEVACFPEAKHAVRIESQSLSELTTLVSHATGLTFSSSTSQTQERLASTRVDLSMPVEVGADDLYPWFEALLVQHGFVLAAPLEVDPPLAMIALSRSSAQPALLPFEVEANHRDFMLRHPALYVRTTLALPHIDVRVLGSTLRPLSNGDGGALTPVGTSGPLALQGSALWVARMVDFLNRVDSESALASTPAERLAILESEVARAAAARRE